MVGGEMSPNPYFVIKTEFGNKKQSTESKT
jgi:hypothetical protein